MVKLKCPESVTTGEDNVLKNSWTGLTETVLTESSGPVTK